MGWFKKDTIEEHKYIDIFWMKKQGLLKEYCNTGINWKNTWGESSIGIIIDIQGTSGSIQLIYTYTDRSSQKEDINYKVDLVSTNCFYGGKRWWFICPNLKCGKRIAKLYLYGKYFICRHCADLTYESCQKSGSNFVLGKLIDLETDIEELRDKTKIYFRKGEMTKNALKLWRMKQNSDILFQSLDKEIKEN